jgi:hypothetical protein
MEFTLSLQGNHLMPNFKLMKKWLMAVFVCAVSFNTLGQTDMRHMRGAHATSNYGANVAGFGKPALSLPETITADRVAVQISRSVSKFGTWDLAAVTLTGVTVGNGPKLASAGFWLSSNPITGAISLSFNPSVDGSLGPIGGFAGDVVLARAPGGESIDLTQMRKATGMALVYATAVAFRGSDLVSNATYQASADSGLRRDTLIQALDAVKASIEYQDGARLRYFEFLRANNVEWIGFNLPIFNDSIADPTVRLKYQAAGDKETVYSFNDEDLEDFIVAAKRADFKVWIGFEFYPVIMDVSPSSPGCGTPNYKPNRWLLGQPVVSPTTVQVESCINPADWWWAPSHPLHATNVAIFWNSFTQIAVKYAAMAQRTGVDMFMLSTEQDNLFRTRAGPAPYTNHFRNELTAMVTAVRAEYSGVVSYEQIWTAIAHPEYFAGGKGTAEAFAGVFDDLNFNVVALSAYFNLTTSAPTSVLSVGQFEAAWDTVFKQHLVPLQQRHPNKRIFFSEWGYTNDIAAPFIQGSRLGEPMQPGAAGAAGITQQRNIIEAFFNVNSRYNDLISGSFFWGLGFQDSGDCQKITFGVHCKPEAAQALTQGYGRWLQTDVNRVFDWAQSVYPNLFRGTSTSGEALGYLYRYYPDTGTYMGVRNGRAYVHNAREFNFLDVGSFHTYLDGAAKLGY